MKWRPCGHCALQPGSTKRMVWNQQSLPTSRFTEHTVDETPDVAIHEPLSVLYCGESVKSVLHTYVQPTDS